jgi:hypothetical protein
VATVGRPQLSSAEGKRDQQSSVSSAISVESYAELEIFRPGDVVPHPGTYFVAHSKHRSPHPAKVRFSVFPQCAKCGSSVRFLAFPEDKGLVAEWLRRDPDFKEALKSERKKPVKSGLARQPAR